MIRSAQELENDAFFGSALYNEIWRPQGLHTRLEAVVRNAGGRPLGSLVLYRGPGERSFSREDEVLLEQASRYVARGLGCPAPGWWPASSSSSATAAPCSASMPRGACATSRPMR